MDVALILFHKQKSSARTRFLRLGDTVVEPLPAPSRVAERAGPVRPHPAALLHS